MRRRSNIYLYSTTLGRAGLANRLFPWARAEIFARAHDVPMLAPQWIVPKVGPLLRGERDLRLYAGQFSGAGHVTGPRRLYVLATAGRVKETDAPALLAADVPAAGWRPRLILFDDKDYGFVPLAAHRAYVRQRLLDILSPRIRRRINGAGLPRHYVGVHVRRSDHGRTLAFGEKAPRDYKWNIPIEWFIAAVRHARSRAGDLPVVVFSDGTREQLAPLLKLPATTLAPPRPAIVDLVLLSRASTVVGSNSTFSQWAVFLEAAPSIWYPGSLYDEFPADQPVEFVSEQGSPAGLTADCPMQDRLA